MTRSQIEYILALERHKNFGRAADACFVTQSTLSAMVAKFEEQCGLQLFNRKTRPISVTPRGEILIRSLKGISREFSLLDETINEMKGQEIGALSLACIPTVAPYLYPLILDQISSQFKEVHFSIHELTTERIIEDLVAGNIDVGIVSTPLEHPELVEYDLYKEDFLIYDCKEKKGPSKYSLSDIELDRLWLMEEGHCLRNQVGKICELRQQSKINGNITYSCGAIYTLIEMVRKNKGITLLPRLALKHSEHSLDAQLHDFKGSNPTRMVGMVTHRNFTKNKILERIGKTIKHAVRPHLPAEELLSVNDVIKPF